MGTYHCVVFVLAVIALSACQLPPTEHHHKQPHTQPAKPASTASDPLVTGLVRRRCGKSLLRPADRPLRSAGIQRLVLVKAAPAGTPPPNPPSPTKRYVCPAISPASNLTHLLLHQHPDVLYRLNNDMWKCSVSKLCSFSSV